MSKGFFTIAQGPQYQRLAYALALSLKISQAENSNLSIGVTSKEKKNLPKKYLEVFDQVIEFPWGDHAEKSQWKLENEWKAIYMSPYDETIKLDADMIFTNDISAWWNYLADDDYSFCTKPLTYRSESITSDYYRKVFTESLLPNIYTAFFYFKKTEPVFEIFKVAEFIFNNWERCFLEFLEPEYRPKLVSTDVVFAIAAKIVGYKPPLFEPTFVHMKSQLQHWPNDQFMIEDWTKMIQVFFNRNCSLSIGNYAQHLPVHYHIKSFVTDTMIKTMERKLNV